MIRKWLRYLWENEEGFFGIGMGPSGQQKQQYGEMSNLENFGISHGMKDTTEAENFWSSILSGDPTQISKVLGPEISAVNKQTQERKKTMAEFGNRGGGTNAAAQTLDDKSVGAIRSMIANLTGSAASTLGATGSSLLSTGESAGSKAFDEASTIQRLNQAKWGDIISSIANIAGVAGDFVGGKGGEALTGVAGVLQG